MPEVNQFDLESIKVITEQKNKAKKEKQYNKLSEFLLQFKIFKIIYERNGQNNFLEIVKNFGLKTYQSGQTIYDKPQKRTFNFLIKGVVMLFTNKFYNKDRMSPQDNKQDESQEQINCQNQIYFYKRVLKNQYFGERLHLSKTHQIVSARSVSNTTTVVQIDLVTLYKSFVGFFSFKELEQKVNFLKKVATLKNLSTRKLERLIQMSIVKKYVKNTILYKQHQMPQFFMVILHGTITLTKNIQELNAFIKKFDISLLSKYQSLGMEQILKNQPYTSTAICTSQKTEILCIQTSIIRQILDIYIVQELQIQKEKQYWRKRRFESLEDISNKLKKTEKNQKNYISLRYSNTKNKIQTNAQKYEFTLNDRQKLLTVEQQKCYTHRTKEIQRRKNNISLSQRKNTTFHSNSNHSLGDELFTRYIQKKHKNNFKMFKKYGQSHASEFMQDPARQNSLVRAFYVKRNQAIKNTKRQLKSSRREFYKGSLLTQNIEESRKQKS